MFRELCYCLDLPLCVDYERFVYTQLGFIALHVKISSSASSVMTQDGIMCLCVRLNSWSMILILWSISFHISLILKLLMIYHTILTTVSRQIIYGPKKVLSTSVHCSQARCESCCAPHQYKSLICRLLSTDVYKWAIEHRVRRVKSSLKTAHWTTGIQNLTNRHFYWWTVSFSSCDIPDGTWCSEHYKRLQVNERATLYPRLLHNHKTWSVSTCNESVLLRQ